MSTLIGLAGAARSGKDTVANVLTQDHGYTRVAFGDKLKEAAYALNPSIPPFWRGRDERLADLVDILGWEATKDAYPEVRRILQALGTEAGWRIHGKNLWVDAAAATIDALPEGTPVVISDVRFPHEVDWIRNQGGRIATISRPQNAKQLVGPTSTHISETLNWIEPDFHINNDGTISDLQAKADILTHP